MFFVVSSIFCKLNYIMLLQISFGLNVQHPLWLLIFGEEMLC